MRKISEVQNFPFLSKGINYYEAKDNMLYELNNDELLIKEAYLRALNGESNLYATWHGEYRTDMFAIDDLHKLGLAFCFEKSDHEHIIEWKYSDPQEKGVYVSVDVKFKCGCTFDSVDGLQKLKKDLLLCKGWEVSGSYMGGYNGSYILRVKKSTIK